MRYLADVLLLLLWQAKLAATAYVHKYPYLYATKDDSNASFPILEHLSPEYRGLDKDAIDRPDFLYAPNQGYRIVEFYIHYCNTCKLFAPIFRQFAVKVKALAEQAGTTIDVHTVSCSPNRKLCVDQEIKGFPRIRLYKADSTEYHQLSHHTQIHPLAILGELGIDFDGTDEPEDDWDFDSAMRHQQQQHTSQRSLYAQLVSYVTGQALPTSQQEGFTQIKRTRDDLKADTYLSFDYAMRNEVYTSSKALTAEQQAALRAWLQLLMDTLPSSWELKNLVQELIDNFMFVVKSEDYLVAVLDEFPSPEESWSASCSHGIWDQGYTCGLWGLFHTVTMGVVDANNAAFDATKILATESSARVLRNYVDQFFGCEICREHFVTSFDNCAHERCDRLSERSSMEERDWKELPLWLFETHNAVNVRLAVEQATREQRSIQAEEMKHKQWPSRRECTTCWFEHSSNNWNASIIFEYLRLEYGQRDAKSAEFRRELVITQQNAARSGALSLWNNMIWIDSASPIYHASFFVAGMLSLNLCVKWQRP